MKFARILRHFLAEDWSLRRAFPRASLNAIGLAIARQERRHGGQLRFAVEGGLPFLALLRGQNARERALEWFSALRMWDTALNNGVLIYLMLGDRSVEIVADRGIHEKVGAAAWDAICGEMQRKFAEHRYEDGVILGVAAVSDLLAAHFPHRAGAENELPDDPVVS